MIAMKEIKEWLAKIDDPRHVSYVKYPFGRYSGRCDVRSIKRVGWTGGFDDLR